MPAILVQKGTNYACNDKNFLTGFSTQHDHFEAVWNFLDIAGILGPNQIRLRAYMVPHVTDIAGIFDPLFN